MDPLATAGLAADCPLALAKLGAVLSAEAVCAGVEEDALADELAPLAEPSLAALVFAAVALAVD